MSAINIFSPTSNKRLSLLSLTILLLSGWSFGQAAIKLSATSGWPTYSLKVSGSNFSPAAVVNIYFDSTQLTSATSDSTGSFSNIPIKIPASTLPGTHYITATAASTSAKAGFMVRTNWIQDGFDSNHTRVNPYENVLSPANVGNLKLRWSYAAPNSVGSASSPAVANGIVYFSAGKKIYALNATTGSFQWSYTEPGGNLFCSPIAVGWGVVYVGSAVDYKVHALNAKTGALLWSHQTTDDACGSPALWNGVVYIGTGSDDRLDGKLYALNASTGALVWSYEVGGGGARSYPYAVVNSGAVYVNGGLSLYSLNPRTGALQWKYSTDGYLTAGPSARDGVVYFSANIMDQSYALNACTGAVLWNYTGGLSLPAFANGVVYHTWWDDANNNSVDALNAQTGAVLWTYTYSVLGVGQKQTATVANGVVYVFGMPTIALDANTGKLLWSYPVSNVHCDLYLGDGTGEGHCPSGSDVVVANGMAYFVDNDGVLRAFGL